MARNVVAIRSRVSGLAIGLRARIRAEACWRFVADIVSDDTLARYAIEHAVEQYARPVRSAWECRWPDKSAGIPHMQHGFSGGTLRFRGARFASRLKYPQTFRQKILPVFLKR